VVTWLLNQIEKKHGKMTIKRGKKHTFVGMDIEFIENSKVKITLEDYIIECINDFKDDVEGTATTPADKGLFETNECSPKLSKENMRTFTALL